MYLCLFIEWPFLTKCKIYIVESFVISVSKCISTGVFTCGPASVKAVRQGEIFYGYDTKFIFAEVNGDRVHWTVDQEGNMVPIGIEEKIMGKYISTKAVSTISREDLTNTYKFSEGTTKLQLISLRKNSFKILIQFLCIAWYFLLRYILKNILLPDEVFRYCMSFDSLCCNVQRNTHYYFHLNQVTYSLSCKLKAKESVVVDNILNVTKLGDNNWLIDEEQNDWNNVRRLY